MYRKKEAKRKSKQINADLARRELLLRKLQEAETYDNRIA